MSKHAKASNCGKGVPSGIQRLLLAGVAAAGCFYMAPAAQAQQAYYFPQASTAPVSVNYGALTPYAAPVAPGVPTGFQPYGYAPNARVSAAPKSVFAPYGQPAYARPAYTPPAPVYGQPVYGYAAAPTVAPFVAPYANPAFAPGFATNRGGLPVSTPTSTGYPQSYLNAPGAQQSADATPTKKKRKKKKAAAPAEMPASTPTATEEAAAAQVAAAEAVLESTPALPAPEAPAVEAPAAETQAAAAPEPVPAPTPPAEPEAVPASVPSPAANVPAAATAVAPAAESASSETPAATTETPAAEAAPAAEQVASAEAPAETAPDTGGNAVLPAGGTRIVFEPGSDDLPQGATADLDALADKMLGDQNMKIQVLAYSSGTPDAESQARRKALARGLEVRKYLIGKGVRSNRIDVRALGTKSEGDPADRVDIVPAAG